MELEFRGPNSFHRGHSGKKALSLHRLFCPLKNVFRRKRVPAIGEYALGLSPSRLAPAPRSHRESDRERRRSAATIRETRRHEAHRSRIAPCYLRFEKAHAVVLEHNIDRGVIKLESPSALAPG